jgi:uncharacterized protein
VARPFGFDFEWDPAKARENAKKHKVTFERATAVFLDHAALSRYDDDHSQEEVRWVTLGLDRQGIPLVVCHTFHEESDDSARIRVISARKATKAESRQYKR